MPHNISQREGKAAVMVVGQPAWHRLGTVLDKPATAAQAIKAAHLDWDVIKQPLFAGEAEHYPVPGRYAVVRADDWAKKKASTLGIVGESYTPVQNREAFSFFDPIVGEKAAIYHTAGALGDGERVWVLAKLPDDIRVIGDDITEKYLLLSNSHDGNSAVQIKFTPIRVVCQNTLTLALSEGPTLRVPHTRDVQQRLRIAASMLNAVKVRYGELESTFQGMASVQVDGAMLQHYLRQVFPDPRQRGDEARYLRAQEQARIDRPDPTICSRRAKATSSEAWPAQSGRPSTGLPSTSTIGDMPKQRMGASSKRSGSAMATQLRHAHISRPKGTSTPTDEVRSAGGPRRVGKAKLGTIHHLRLHGTRAEP